MWIPRFTVLLLIAAGLLLPSLPALAEQRVALVIGNAAYAHAPRLANPLNDADDVGAALTRLGFAVTKLENADSATLRQGLQAFARAASAADVAVVFYAGHGIEVDQRNFLVPVDARLTSDQDVEFETVPLELAMRSVARASGLRLVILDACRDNPFAVSMQRAGATRSVGRGLARVEPAGETLVAYASKEGTVAADGEGRNSPYSEALLAHLEEPGLEVGLLFRKVRDAVLATTGGRQEPFVYGSLSSRGVYLTARAEPAPDASTAPAPAPVSESAAERLTAEQMAAQRLAAERELLFWESVKDSTNPADIQAYLDRYPGGTYEVLARNRLEALQRPEVLPEASAELVEGRLKLTRAEHRLIQLGLLAAGFDLGRADGLIGAKTRAALRQWQASRGEAVTGYLDVESAKVLLAAGEQSAARQAAAEAERLRREQEARQRQEEAARRQREEAERRRRQLEPGRRFRDCPGCPEMVVVPAGSFMMGSPPGEAGRDDDDGPQHRVTIAEPFAVGVFEVTFREWGACVSGGGCNGYRPDDKGWGRGDRPVINVSWDDAQAYVRWLSGKTRQRYRLLSESEWEYVARAGTTGPFHTGATISTDQANYDGNYTYGGGRQGVYRKRTVPVGTFSPNGFGLHDVHGNVWEWTQDCWNEGYNGAPRDGRAWAQGNCSRRVARGGSWSQRTEVPPGRHPRTGTPPETATNYQGFRIARTLTP